MAAARLVFSLSLPSSTHGINRKFQPFLLTQTVAPSRVRALRCQANPESSEPQVKKSLDFVIWVDGEFSLKESFFNRGSGEIGGG